eukprot:scaffold159216_cov17-Tisochrysis_lutea.AAC.1
MPWLAHMVLTRGWHVAHTVCSVVCIPAPPPVTWLTCEYPHGAHMVPTFFALFAAHLHLHMPWLAHIALQQQTVITKCTQRLPAGRLQSIWQILGTDKAQAASFVLEKVCGKGDSNLRGKTEPPCGSTTDPQILVTDQAQAESCVFLLEKMCSKGDLTLRGKTEPPCGSTPDPQAEVPGSSRN